MSASGDGLAALEPRRHPAGDGLATRLNSGVIAALRSGWKLILASTVVCAVAAYAVSTRAPEQYRASARVFLDGSTLSANGADPVRQVLTQSKLALSAEAIAMVSKQLQLTEATAEAHVTAEAAPNGNFFTVSGTSTTRAGAVALVSAVERVYQSLVIEQRRGGGTKLLDQLVSQRVVAQAAYEAAQKELAATPGDDRLQARVAVLAAQLRALSSEETDAFTVESPNGNPVILAEEPQLPTLPSTPKPKRDSLLGGVFGLLLAAAVLWWRASRLTTVASTDVYSATGLARLVELPEIARWGRRRRRDRLLRDDVFVEAALAFDLAMPNDLKVLLLAPCRRRDLAPEVAAGLAGALARDRKVVLFDGNPGDRTLTDALERLGVGQGETPIQLTPGLVALPSHDVLGGALFVPARELQGPATRHDYSYLIAELGKAAHLVVVVGPPPDASLSAALLAASADAAVIVARNDTPLRRVVSTKDRLTSLARPTLGLILDRTRSSSYPRHRSS